MGEDVTSVPPFSKEAAIVRLRQVFADAYGRPFEESDLSGWLESPNPSIGMTPVEYLEKYGESGERILGESIRGAAMGVHA